MNTVAYHLYRQTFLNFEMKNSKYLLPAISCPIKWITIRMSNCRNEYQNVFTNTLHFRRPAISLHIPPMAISSIVSRSETLISIHSLTYTKSSSQS